MDTLIILSYGCCTAMFVEVLCSLFDVFYLLSSVSWKLIVHSLHAYTHLFYHDKLLHKYLCFNSTRLHSCQCLSTTFSPHYSYVMLCWYTKIRRNSDGQRPAVALDVDGRIKLSILEQKLYLGNDTRYAGIYRLTLIIRNHYMMYQIASNSDYSEVIQLLDISQGHYKY